MNLKPYLEIRAKEKEIARLRGLLHEVVSTINRHPAHWREYDEILGRIETELLNNERITKPNR
jgi:hypothetical protein